MRKACYWKSLEARKFATGKLEPGNSLVELNRRIVDGWTKAT